MKIKFIETTDFSDKVRFYLDDEELGELQLFLIINPNAGSVIKHSGGLRKVRWSGNGKGKSGGFIVIYFHRASKNEIWLLDIYSKNQIENISEEKLKILRKEVTDD